MVIKPTSYADKGKAPASLKRGLDNDEEDAERSDKRPRNSIQIGPSDCLPNDIKQEEIDAELRAIDNGENRLSSFIVPKEEQIDEKEFERIIEERFQRHFGRLSSEEAPKSIDDCSYLPSTSDTRIWKVKCSVGRERKLVFCLMQKYVYFTYIKKDLQIISAFTVDRIKGFIFVEADKECYAYEACKSFDGLYYSKLEELSRKEVSLLLSTMRQEPSSIREGMSVKVANGSYKGDIGEVWNVNKKRAHAVVKLVPRIDLKELAQKFGGEKNPLKLVTPAPKLISSLELAEFGSLVKEHINRSTGEKFQVLGGLMLKDGYLFKKIPLDSLSIISPSPFKGLCQSESSGKQSLAEKEWVNEFFPTSMDNKERETPECKPDSRFEMGEIVFWGRNNFGMVISIEVGNIYKVLKDELEGHFVITIDESLLKHGPSCAKFSAFDMLKRGVFMNDRVRVSEGILKDKEGFVKKIYKGILFICDENESENGGYFCCKALLCEKLTNYNNNMSSPNSPQSQKESTKALHRSRENSNLKYFAGQRMRIKVRPLKGHLCSFVKKHQSDVTVRLDTKQKTVLVKLDHLCEVHETNSSLPTREVEHLNSGTNDVEWNSEANQLNTNCSAWDTPASNKDAETGWNEEMQDDHNSSWNDGSSKKNNDGWSAPANPSWEAPSSSWKTSEAGEHESTHVDHNLSCNNENSKKKDSGWSNENNKSWNAPSSLCQNNERGWNEITQDDYKSSWNHESSIKSGNEWSTEANTSWNAPSLSSQNSERGWNEDTQVVHKSSWNQESSEKSGNGWNTETKISWNAPSSSCQVSGRGWKEDTQADHKSSWNQENSKKCGNERSTETTRSWNAQSSLCQNNERGWNDGNQVDHKSSWNQESSENSGNGWSVETNTSWNAQSFPCQNKERGWNEGTQVGRKSSWNQESSKKSGNGWNIEANTPWNAPHSSRENSKIGRNEAAQVDNNSSWSDEGSKKNDSGWNAPNPSWKNSDTGGHEAPQVDQSKQNLSWDDGISKKMIQESPWGAQAEKDISEQCGGWGKAPNTDDSSKESGLKSLINVDEKSATSSKFDSNVSGQDNQRLKSWSSLSGQKNAATTNSERKIVLSNEISSWDAEIAVGNDRTVGWGRNKEGSFVAKTTTNNDLCWSNKGKQKGSFGNDDGFSYKNNGRGKYGWNSDVTRGSFKSNFNSNNGGNCSWGRGQNGKNSRNYNDGESWSSLNRSSWGKQEKEKEWGTDEKVESSSCWGKQEISEKGSSKNTESDSGENKADNEWA